MHDATTMTAHLLTEGFVRRQDLPGLTLDQKLFTDVKTRLADVGMELVESAFSNYYSVRPTQETKAQFQEATTNLRLSERDHALIVVMWAKVMWPERQGLAGPHTVAPETIVEEFGEQWGGKQNLLQSLGRLTSLGFLTLQDGLYSSGPQLHAAIDSDVLNAYVQDRARLVEIGARARDMIDSGSSTAHQAVRFFFNGHNDQLPPREVTRQLGLPPELVTQAPSTGGRAMFRIKSVLLSQFAYQRSVRVPFEGENTLIGGPNGSGKTTLLDAVRLCLGSERLSHAKNLRKEYLRPEGAYHVVGLVAINRIAGKPGLFSKIAHKAETVTLARVYIPKGDAYESSFVIMDGEPDVETIIRTAEGTTSDRYTPDKYRETLALLGITPDALEHLIVRQSRVTDVATMGGRELYQAVLGAAGSKETSQKYALARKIALQEHEKLLARRSDDVETRRILEEQKVLRDRRRAWERKTQEINDLREEKEARTAHDLMKDLEAHQASVANADEQSGPLTMQLADAERELTEKRQKLKILQNPPDAERRQAVERAYEDARKLHEGLVSATAQRMEAQRRLKTAPKDTSAAAELLLHELRDAWAVACAEEKQAALAVTALEQEAIRLRAGDPFPAPVTATVEQLRAAGISYSVLAEVITLPKGSEAAFEHALGDLRFTLIVAASDLQATLQVAKQNAYPGPITTDAGDARKEAIRAARGPGWLAEYALTPDGIVDRHGTWVGVASTLVTGKDAAKTALRANADTLKAASAALGRAAAARNAKDLAMRKQDELWRRCLQRDQDLATAADLDEVQANKTKALAEMMRISHELRQVGDQADFATQTAEVAKAIPVLERTVKTQRERLVGYAETIRKGTERIRDLQDQLQTQRTKVAPEWHAKLAAGAPIPSTQKSLDDRITDLTSDIRTLGEIPDEDIHANVARLAAAAENYSKRLAQQQATFVEANASLAEARAQYAKFCTSIIDLYAKRVKDWARQFNVECTVQASPLTQTATDDGIDQATLSVSFGYEKPPAPSNTGPFSGGEAMINRIIMRLAMTNPKSDSFFIVDQPYDNLDFHNVKLVAEHLRQTSLHVIIVVPDSDSSSAYQGVVRGIKMHKAKGAQWAPPPDVMAVRDKEEPVAAV